MGVVTSEQFTLLIDWCEREMKRAHSSELRAEIIKLRDVAIALRGTALADSDAETPATRMAETKIVV